MRDIGDVFALELVLFGGFGLLCITVLRQSRPVEGLFNQIIWLGIVNIK